MSNSLYAKSQYWTGLPIAGLFSMALTACRIVSIARVAAGLFLCSRNRYKRTRLAVAGSVQTIVTGGMVAIPLVLLR